MTKGVDRGISAKERYMNREEAKELFRNDKNSYGGVKSPMSKIDLIYNDFDIIIESLKCCGNCDLENIWYGENECPHRDECIESDLSGLKSFWQPINK